ncbi:MAG: serine/threonine-protein kinase [Planctomycetota bacterium]
MSGSGFDAPAHPRELGGYRILECLGRGSFATVYRAQRAGLPGSVALKVLPPHVHGEALERFKREARLASRLEHPGIVRCFDVGRDPRTGVHYLGLEFVQGSSLEDRLRAGGALPWRQAVELMIPVADAVAYAHAQEVIHRDLKPANVLLDGQGQPRVTDFGLARDQSSNLTTAGEVLGTPFYMAPEQIQGARATPQFDVHALGAILYELLTSSPPYPGTSVAEVSQRIMAGNPPPPSTLSPYPLPRALDQLVAEALASDPARRTRSAAEFALALRRLLVAGEEPPASSGPHPRSFLGFALGAGGGLALGLIALFVLAPLAPRPAQPPRTAPVEEAPAPTDAPPPAPVDAPSPAPDPTPALGADDPWRRSLERARETIRAWNWPSAREQILEVARQAQGELAQSEARRLRTLLESELEREAATVADVEARYTERFLAWEALEAAERELAAHPTSLGLKRAAARLNAVCGRARRAYELAQDFPPDRQQDKELLVVEKALLDLPPGADEDAALWRDWAPLEGALWTQGPSGELHGRGDGLGPFQFAGLVRREPRQLAAPYRLQVEVRLDHDRPVSYAGVGLALEDPGTMLLVYVFHHEKLLDELASAEDRVKIRAAADGRVKYVRLATFKDGRWTHLDTQITRFPDQAWIPLGVDVGPDGLQVEVGGRPAAQARLRRPLPAGRVALIKFYDTDATFRGFELTPR